MFNGIEQFLAQHLLSAMSATTVLGAAGVWIANNWGAFVTKETVALDGKMLGAIKNPAVKAFAIKVTQALDAAVPDAGDAKYAAMTDLIMAELPPAAIAARPVILALLTGLGTGIKAGSESSVAAAQQPAAGS